jgi:hypothetical protein
MDYHRINYNNKLNELIMNNMYDNNGNNTLLGFLINLKNRDYSTFRSRIIKYTTSEEYEYFSRNVYMSSARWNDCDINNINVSLNNDQKFKNIVSNIYNQVEPIKQIEEIKKEVKKEVKNITINKNEQPKKLGGNKNTLLLKMENSMKKKTQKSNRKLKTLECLMRCEERQSTLNNINNKQKMNKQLKLLKQKINK